MAIFEMKIRKIGHSLSIFDRIETADSPMAVRWYWTDEATPLEISFSEWHHHHHLYLLMTSQQFQSDSWKWLTLDKSPFCRIHNPVKSGILLIHLIPKLSTFITKWCSKADPTDFPCVYGIIISPEFWIRNTNCAPTIPPFLLPPHNAQPNVAVFKSKISPEESQEEEEEA